MNQNYVKACGYGEQSASVADGILKWQIKADERMAGLVTLLERGFDLQTRDIDVLIINGQRAEWWELEIVK